METWFQLKVTHEPEMSRCSLCHSRSEHFIHFITEHVLLPLNQRTGESHRVNSWSSLNPWCTTHQLSLTQKFFPCFKNATGANIYLIHPQRRQYSLRRYQGKKSLSPAHSVVYRQEVGDPKSAPPADLWPREQLLSFFTDYYQLMPCSNLLLCRVTLHNGNTYFQLSGKKNYILQRGIINSLCHHVLFQRHMNVEKKLG